MVTLVCYSSDSEQQRYYERLQNSAVKLADISIILSLMKLYLETGVAVKLAHAVFPLLPSLYLGTCIVVKLAYVMFTSPRDCT